jgi:glycosyltransferase involved in cell wall biosynthesis
MMVGLRGFPNTQGGIEVHAEHICPRLAEIGYDVHVICRTPYHSRAVGDVWKGVRFHRVWTPRSKALEAIVHTFLGVLYAGIIKRPDILHIHAIGPALMTPIARLLGLRVVVTHHGPDYDRQKWGGFARQVLQLGERFGMRWANARIAISDVIRGIVRAKHTSDCVLIPNGVDLPILAKEVDRLAPFGLVSGQYVLLVSRLVPEKRHLDLIDAFRIGNLRDWKLAIVGASDHPDEYTRRVLGRANNTPGVVCTGYQTGDTLRQLYSHAGIFVLPSSHEGLPIALLEALSYGVQVIASDIAANIELGLDRSCYFALGDVKELAAKLVEKVRTPWSPDEREQLRYWVADKYNWDRVARQTADVYRAVVRGSVTSRPPS